MTPEKLAEWKRRFAADDLPGQYEWYALTLSLISEIERLQADNAMLRREFNLGDYGK